MKTGYRKLSFITVLLTICIAVPVYGADAANSSDGWEIRLMPYFWMPEIDAGATISGLSGNVDLKFNDILDNLDFVAMGRMEAWKGKWGLTFDGLYMNLGADGSLEGTYGITSFDLDVDVRLGMADFGLAYRLFERRFGNHDEQCFTFEPYGGLRYAYLREKVDLNINIAGVGSTGARLGGSQDWVEPFVGGRIRWDLNEKMGISVRADAGGFGIGSASDLTWNFEVGFDYKLSKNMSFQAGYRILDIDYSRGSGSQELGLDAKVKGPVLGMTIVF